MRRAEGAQGAHPYFMPVAHTEFARETVGPDALLAPEAKVVFETDESKAIAAGFEASRMYLQLSNYVNAWREFGFPDLKTGDPATGAFLDAHLARGGPGEIAARLRPISTPPRTTSRSKSSRAPPIRSPAWPGSRPSSASPRPLRPPPRASALCRRGARSPHR